MPHFVSFHLSDEAAINEVMMALVASLAAILFGQPDAVDLKLIDCADMTPSPPNYYHVFFDLGRCEFLPCSLRLYLAAHRSFDPLGAATVADTSRVTDACSPGAGLKGRN
jgi:hypothetical protein